MKAYDVMIFFIMLNTSFWVLNAMGIWVGPGSPVGTPALIIYLTFGFAGALLGEVILYSVVYIYGSRLSSPDVAAIRYFYIAYTFLVGSGTGILWSLYIPWPIITVLIGIEGIVLFIAIVQMSGKVSFKLMD